MPKVPSAFPRIYFILLLFSFAVPTWASARCDDLELNLQFDAYLREMRITPILLGDDDFVQRLWKRYGSDSCRRLEAHKVFFCAQNSCQSTNRMSAWNDATRKIGNAKDKVPADIPVDPNSVLGRSLSGGVGVIVGAPPYVNTNRGSRPTPSILSPTGQNILGSGAGTAE